MLGDWQKTGSFTLLGNRKPSPSLVPVPSCRNIYRVHTHSSAAITEPMVFFVRFSWPRAAGMHNQSGNQSEKQLQWLVCSWMAAMKSLLSALWASCGASTRLKEPRRMRRLVRRYSTQRRASAPMQPSVVTANLSPSQNQSLWLHIARFEISCGRYSLHSARMWQRWTASIAGKLNDFLCGFRRCRLHLQSVHQPCLHQHPCLFPVITIIPVFVRHSTRNPQF